MQFYLWVLKVGDLYVLPKGVGHFFFTLHGTTHSVIGMQTVFKRPPPDDVSTITRGQFAELCEAFKTAGRSQDGSAPLFELKQSAAGAGGGDGLYVKDGFQAPVPLPAFGEAMLLGDERLTHEFFSEHRGRVIKTAWFVQADEADKVSSECVDVFKPPPPPSDSDVIAFLPLARLLCSTGGQAGFRTRNREGERIHRTLSPRVCRWSALAAPEPSGCGTGPELPGAIRTRRLPRPAVQCNVPEKGRRPWCVRNRFNRCVHRIRRRGPPPRW